MIIRIAFIVLSTITMCQFSWGQSPSLRSVEDRIGSQIGQLVLQSVACDVRRETLQEQVADLTKKLQEAEKNKESPAK